MDRVAVLSVSVAFLAMSAAGCGSPARALQQQLLAEQAENAALKHNAEALKREMETVKAKSAIDVEVQKKVAEEYQEEVATLREEMKQVREAWDEFKTSFSSDMQKQLEENVEVAEKAASEATAAGASASEILGELEGLKKQCETHAKTITDLDEISKLRASVKQLKGSVSNADVGAVREKCIGGCV